MQLTTTWREEDQYLAGYRRVNRTACPCEGADCVWRVSKLRIEAV
jgi:hypothetical protein